MISDRALCKLDKQKTILLNMRVRPLPFKYYCSNNIQHQQWMACIISDFPRIDIIHSMHESDRILYFWNEMPIIIIRPCSFPFCSICLHSLITHHSADISTRWSGNEIIRWICSLSTSELIKLNTGTISEWQFACGKYIKQTDYFLISYKMVFHDRNYKVAIGSSSFLKVKNSMFTLFMQLNDKWEEQWTAVEKRVS